MEILWAVIGRLVAGRDLVILLLAYWLVTALAKRRAPAEGLAPEWVGDAAFWLGLGAVVGARLASLLPVWPVYLRYPLDLLRIDAGLSFYGAVVGTLAVAAWCAWRHRLPLGRTADLFAPYLALGVAFQRAGCLVRGDCFGAVAPPPLGLVFPGFAQPRYPAELYEAVLALGLCGLLLLWRERRRFPGELGLAFLIGYPLLRAGVDFFRINLGGWPTVDQLVSLTVAAAAAAVWLWRSRRGGATAGVGGDAAAGSVTPARRQDHRAEPNLRRR